MANRKITDLTAADQLDGNDLFIITDTTTGTSQRLTGQQVIDFVNSNANIPTTVDDIAGLTTILNSLETGKLDTDGNILISQVSGLQDALDGKLDDDDVNLAGRTLYVKGTPINIPSTAGEGDVTGGSLPTTSTAGNFLQFSDNLGNVEEKTLDEQREDLGIDQVANINPVDYPVSTAQQTALDLKRNTADSIPYSSITDTPTTITTDQSSAIAANTLKGDFTSADEIKLDGIESLADVTDTENVWAATGISTEGRTNYALSERGVFVQIPDSAGNVLPVITEVHTEQVSIASGGGMAVFTITGIENNTVTASIVNSTPANWITNASLDSTTVDIDTNGTATVTATVPSFSDLSGTRSFQLQVQVDGAFQPAVTSEVVTQYTASQLITGISLSVISFGNDSAIEMINVAGIVGEGYSLELFDVLDGGSASAWITSGALSATTGIIGADGTDSTNTIAIPSAQDDTVNRSFRLRARATDDNSIFAETAIITQVHTQSSSSGNLTADAGALVSGNDINFTVTVSQGDAPFTAVVNQSATDSTDNPLGTLNFSDLNMVQSFTSLAASDFTGPTEDFYVHISDNDGDIVVEMETLTLVNNPPTGDISQTMGAMSPAIGDTVEFTSAFTDPEGDTLTYQWQFNDSIRTIRLSSSDTFNGSATSATFTVVSGYIPADSEIVGWTGFLDFNPFNDLTFNFTVTSNTSTTIDVSLVNVDDDGFNVFGFNGLDLVFTDPGSSYTNIAGETNAIHDYLTNYYTDGFYRVQVSDGSNNVTSNEVEIERSWATDNSGETGTITNNQVVYTLGASSEINSFVIDASAAKDPRALRYSVILSSGFNNDSDFTLDNITGLAVISADSVTNGATALVQIEISDVSGNQASVEPYITIEVV